MNSNTSPTPPRNLLIYYEWEVWLTVKNKSGRLRKNSYNAITRLGSSLSMRADAVVTAEKVARKRGGTPQKLISADMKGIAFVIDCDTEGRDVWSHAQVAEMWRTDIHNPKREQI